MFGRGRIWPKGAQQSLREAENVPSRNKTISEVALTLPNIESQREQK
jgi:hypothetical protein